MLNQYAVDIPTLPVNQCLSHLIQLLVECQAVLWECRAATTCRQTFGTRMVYRETFLQIQLRLLQHLIQEGSIRGFPTYQSTSPHVTSERQTPDTNLDASLDRQPQTQSSSVEETLQRIMGQTNNDCIFQIFILANSLTQQHSLVGREDSRLKYVLVHNFLRKLCCGSKKWRWLNQWMI